MVISDKYKFVFIHIPKCAGTTIRGKIQRFDDTNGYFKGKIEKHPVLGSLNYVHIPLSILYKSFPEIYNKILHYESFCIVRDPFKRFPSSLSQHINRYHNTPLPHLSKKEVFDKAYECIDYLNQHVNDEVLPPKYIHFQKQSNYIFHDQSKIVDRIFSTQEISEALNFIEEKTAIHIGKEVERKNETKVYKSRLIQLTVLMAKTVVPREGILHSIYKNKVSKLFMTNRNSRFFDDFYKDSVITDFVNDYYKNDIKLYNQHISN